MKRTDLGEGLVMMDREVGLASHLCAVLVGAFFARDSFSDPGRAWFHRACNYGGEILGRWPVTVLETVGSKVKCVGQAPLGGEC